MMAAAWTSTTFVAGLSAMVVIGIHAALAVTSHVGTSHLPAMKVPKP
jgi:hypothetical protein